MPTEKESKKGPEHVIESKTWEKNYTIPRTRVVEIIEVWFRDHFTNNFISQHTETFNRLYAAKQDLISRLKS